MATQEKARQTAGFSLPGEWLPTALDAELLLEIGDPALQVFAIKSAWEGAELELVEAATGFDLPVFEVGRESVYALLESVYSLVERPKMLGGESGERIEAHVHMAGQFAERLRLL